MGFNGQVEAALQEPSAAVSQILAAGRQLERVQKAVFALEEQHFCPPRRTSASASLDRGSRRAAMASTIRCYGGRPRFRAGPSRGRAAMTTTGTSPISIRPEAVTVLRGVGGAGGRGGGGSPMNGNAGGKLPAGNQVAASRLPASSASDAMWNSASKAAYSSSRSCNRSLVAPWNWRRGDFFVL